MFHLAISEQQRSNRKPSTSVKQQEREREFAAAVERVYRKYGNNLAEFLRDVQKERELSKKG
jgi:hypothetical protein